jgi:hypothetical protein
VGGLRLRPSDVQNIGGVHRRFRGRMEAGPTLGVQCGLGAPAVILFRRYSSLVQLRLCIHLYGDSQLCMCTVYYTWPLLLTGVT